jgi:enterochelin esterase-like enzyme
MVTRRTFLAGSLGAIGVVGGGGLAALGPRRVARKLGLIHSADLQVAASGWPVVERTLTSKAMKGDVRWALALPPVPPTGVIICLHGRGGDRSAAFSNMRIHDFVAASGHSFAVVGIDGTDHAYWHPRLDGTDALSLVIDELIPTADRELGVLPRALLGWSMGGYGSLLAAERFPSLFRAVCAASPALWTTADEPAGDAFDSPSDYAAHDVFANTAALSTLKVRVDCGADDGFIKAARVFAAKLPNQNLGTFGPGLHDGPYWRSIAPAQIATIASAFST